MQRNFRIARACAREAVRDFHWREYAPFGWILGAQLLFLLLALNLDSPMGMAIAGGMSRLAHGEAPLHYPVFFLDLPFVSAILELFLYALPGSILIPLALIRIMEPMDPALEQGEAVKQRLRRAFLPTVTAAGLNLGLLYLWQWLVNVGPAPLFRASLPGFPGILVVWAVSVIGAYALSAILIYVPIAAVRPGANFRSSMKEGLGEGRELFGYTVFLLLAFALPALPFLMVTQLKAAFIAERLRPEIVAIALAFYSTLISAASYFSYAAAARLHWAAKAEES
jgi:hypothetical protein